jgi:phenolic acid decarboxylase
MTVSDTLVHLANCADKHYRLTTVEPTAVSVGLNSIDLSRFGVILGEPVLTEA